MPQRFRFYTRQNLVYLLGRKAADVPQLLEGIRAVPGASIYYHTHRFLQQHHYLSPEPPNDFAYWVNEVLGEPELGERLASIDTVQFQKIEQLRARLVEVLERHLATNGRRPQSPEGAEFHFASCRTFVLPTGREARDLSEFCRELEQISVHSLYFHVFEARLRLERPTNDFSAWFEGLGRRRLAQEVDRIDPYTHTLEGLRKRILALVQRYGDS